MTAAPHPAPFLDEARALACVHCGLCLSACPTYLETGDENQSPRGRIHRMRALQEGRLALTADTVEPIDRCLGCRACEAVCPSGVQYGHLLEHTRDHVEHHHRRSPWQRWLRRVAIEQVFPHPERLEVAVTPATWLRRAGLERWLPAPLRSALALVPERLERADLAPFSPADPAVPRRGRVGLVTGCAMPVFFAPTHAATVRLLNRSGWDVVVPSGQSCCGALHAHGGQLDAARARARTNIRAFAAAAVDHVVINAAGCGSTLKEYGSLLESTEGRDFGARVRDLTELVDRDRLQAAPGLPTVTYHDACHLAHAQGIVQRPRELVRAVAGDAFVELPEADVCCGSAGTYNLTEPEMAARLQRRKADNIAATGARIVVTTNPGCLLQIRAGLEERERGAVTVLHLADFLVRYGLDGTAPDPAG